MVCLVQKLGCKAVVLHV